MNKQIVNPLTGEVLNIRQPRMPKPPSTPEQPKTYAGTGAKIGAATGVASTALTAARKPSMIAGAFKKVRAAGFGKGKAGLMVGGALAGATALTAGIHSAIGATIGSQIKRKPKQPRI